MLISNFSPLGLRTTREITIEDFRRLDKLIVPKGSLVVPSTAAHKTDDSWIVVDAYINGSVFYGVRIEAGDIEPALSGHSFSLS